MEQVSVTSAYMWSFVVMIILLLFAILMANMILFKPGNTGVTKRRIWFWIPFLFTGVIGFLINYVISTGIKVPSLQASYQMHSAIAAISSMVVYVVIGFVLSKSFSNSKIGTWF
jgi:hypothetical protein